MYVVPVFCHPPIITVDMDTSPAPEGMVGLLVYFIFMLVAVFIDSLEAILGVALYWLGEDNEEQRQIPT